MSERKPQFVFHVTSTMAISIAQQFVGLLRHMIIAAFFGVSRQFDGYLVVYAVVTIVVFGLANVFDSVAVARLVQVQDRHGSQAFWKSSNRLLIQSVFGGILAAIAFVVVLWLVLPIVAAGFSESERLYLLSLSKYFLPWILVIIPYYALTSHLKAQWQFHWVFGSELVTMVVSIVVLWFWHETVAALPIAYFTGYLVASAILLYRRGVRGVEPEVHARGLIKDMATQHLANQIGSANGFADRYYQSFLTAGGISSLGYAGQIVNNLSSLLTFRDIYIVPLSTEAGRSEKVERVLKGVVLISVPVAAFLLLFAEPITAVLFQRGQFGADAVSLTSSVLSVLALSLVSSSILAPLQRIFQITNRVFFTHLFYANWLLGTLVLQYLFVFVLKWDVRGFAIASVVNSIFVTIIVAFLVRQCGVFIVWHRVFSYMAYAAAAATIASLVARFASSSYSGLTSLLVASPIYGLIIAAAYLVIHRRIRAIAGMT